MLHQNNGWLKSHVFELTLKVSIQLFLEKGSLFVIRNESEIGIISDAKIDDMKYKV